MPGFLRKSPWSMSHRRKSFCFILSLPLLLSKGPCHARKSVGRRKSFIGGADGPAPANPSLRDAGLLSSDCLSVRGHRQRAQGRRESLQATSRQRSAFLRSSSRSDPQGRDICTAWTLKQPYRLHLGSRTYPTWCCTRNRRSCNNRC